MARQRQVPPSETTVLVVDDQEEVPRSLRGLLAPLGHRVLAASGADAALAVLARETVDLALVDEVMPGRSGTDLIREIRRSRPTLPIILHTGYAGERSPAEVVATLGLQGYHDKADGPEKLLRWIAAATRTQRSPAALPQRGPQLDDELAEASHELRAPAAAAQCVPVAALADELRTATAALLVGTPVRFTVDQRRAPAALRTDPVALRAILRNLVAHAIERTAQGSITLFIAAEGDAVRLAVADTGPAIAADHLPQVFAGAAAPGGAGGLALALSHELARLLGGALTACSHPRGGAVFTLLLAHAALPDEVAAAARGGDHPLAAAANP